MLTVLTDKINDLNLNIDLFQKHDFVPKSESIKKYIDLEVEKVLAESRLSEKDLELISFIPNANFTLRAYFNNTTSYNTVGFTNLFLTANTLYTQESYYVFDLFDTFEDNNQTLISRNFVKMSKIVKDLTTDIIFDVSKKIVKEFVNIYIPSYFINEGVDTFYMKIYFFNATNGKFRYFKCSDTDENASKNYLKLQINRTNKTYSIIGGDKVIVNSSIYKISQVIEPKKEEELLNDNKIRKIKPLIKTTKIITSKGTFI